MSHGSPPRPGHRSYLTGGVGLLTGPALLTRPARPVAQHRRPAQRRAMPEPQRPMQLLMSGLGALIMTALVGLSAFFVIADERRGDRATATPPVPFAAARRPAQEPLSLTEVFPDAEIQLVAGAAPYRIGLTHLDTDCETAASGLLGALLADLSCGQVVRASMTAPYGGYQVTAGIFTLPDAAEATLADSRLGPLMEAGDGTFPLLGAPPGAVTRPLAQVSWHSSGRYLIFCVVSRPDGELVHDDDPYAEQISTDLVESYLGGTVLSGRGSNA
jgi:hypothetical protein